MTYTTLGLPDGSTEAVLTIEVDGEVFRYRRTYRGRGGCSYREMLALVGEAR